MPAQIIRLPDRQSVHPVVHPTFLARLRARLSGARRERPVPADRLPPYLRRDVGLPPVDELRPPQPPWRLL